MPKFYPPPNPLRKGGGFKLGKLHNARRGGFIGCPTRYAVGFCAALARVKFTPRLEIA